MSTPVTACLPELPPAHSETIPMRHTTPKSFNTALLPPGTPMFSDVIDHLGRNPELLSTRNRDVISGLRRVARALGRTPDEVPADARWLRPRLEKVAPAALGLAPKSWLTALSDARTGLRAFGILPRRYNLKSDLNTDWRPLWDMVLASKLTTLARPLCPFVHFLSNQGVAPSEVTEAHAADYLAALEESEIRKSPDGSQRQAVRAWNRAVRDLPDWPRRPIQLASRQKRVKMPDATFPISFHKDIEHLVETLERPDPLDPESRGKALSQQTVQQYRETVLCFAAELVRAGVPPESIIDVAAICQPDMIKTGLRRMLDENGGRTREGIAQHARVLRNLARSYCHVSDDAQGEISALARRVAVSRTGMTGKNRDRLRVLQDEDTMRKLLLLPEQLFASAKAGRKPHFRALDREIAVAIAILIYCPIRIRNLSEIHLERNLRRAADGRAYLVFEEVEVKNARRLEFQLPPDVVRLIDRHLETRTPELCPRGTEWLFPRRQSSGPIDRSNLSLRISRTIHRTTGLEINPHLFRHLAAMIWLDANPGSYEAARRLLGHSATSYTISVYTGMEVRSATRAFSDLISTRRGKAK